MRDPESKSKVEGGEPIEEDIQMPTCGLHMNWCEKVQILQTHTHTRTHIDA